PVPGGVRRSDGLWPAATTDATGRGRHQPSADQPDSSGHREPAGLWPAANDLNSIRLFPNDHLRPPRKAAVAPLMLPSRRRTSMSETNPSGATASQSRPADVQQIVALLGNLLPLLMRLQSQPFEQPLQTMPGSLPIPNPLLDRQAAENMI